MCREKSICAHCAAIIVQLWRKKVVHIVLRLLYNMAGKKLCALCQELKRYFPPTSLFRFRTFSPLIVLLDIVFAVLFRSSVETLFLHWLLKGWVEGPDHVTKQVLPSGFDFGQLGPKLEKNLPHFWQCGQLSWSWTYPNIGKGFCFCPYLWVVGIWSDCQATVTRTAK